ncbi:ParB N-terminal domain-containing protein [Pseudonocardia sp. KRD291]|uniref:ParB/RepB/Spo0J family partition protein n=1 Tax=Pseudonocardia sp. KRD291 TaxID=2792007 RepID=UPI001C4A2FE3|nr:ParB N-terminal domain-containing protein [Pseudonocardia sp. KRD291]MBW0101528.1 ParB N-terminal domain-containing protein [Pseudonocardia sp. KRD291]
MTAEPITTSATHASTAGDAATGQVGELLMVDPTTLELEVNTRSDVRLDPHFVASIRDRGVREPISVRRRGSDGVLVVRKGQRRTLAAVKVGLPQVRVLVEPEPADGQQTAKDAEVERIVDQLTENQHRAAISDADEVGAHQQLLGLGLSEAQRARVTRTPAKRVRQITAVAASELAAAVMGRYDLDLLQLQVIAEFDDDTEAVKALTVTSQQSPAQFEHLAQRLRDERDEQALRAAKAAELAEAGVTVVDTDDHDDATMLDRLRPSEDDAEGTPLTEEAHQGCPGHAADVATFRHWRDGTQVRVTYLCLSPDEHGHHPRYNPSAAATGGAGRAPAGETEEQKAARQAERRRVIANNKAWDSAEVVRRDWLTALFARKAAPKDAGRYVAAELGQGDHDLRRAMESGNALACALLGLDEPRGGGYYSGVVNPIAAAAASAAGPRATMLSLAMVLGGYEAGTHRGSWRNSAPATRRYFTRLQEWGYQLSPVEQLVIDPDSEAPDSEAAVGEATGVEPAADEPGTGGDTGAPADDDEDSGQASSA